MTADLSMQEAAEIVLAEIDIARPELATFPSLAGDDNAVATASSFVAYLRARKSPNLGYPPEMIADLTSVASEDDRQKARDALQKALTAAPSMSGHDTPVNSAGAEALFLGGDEAFCLELAEHCSELA